MNNINQVLALMPDTPEEIEQFVRLMNKAMLEKWNSIFNQLELKTQIRLEAYEAIEHELLMEQMDESIKKINNDRY